MNFFSTIQKYIWNAQATPYFVPVKQLTARQILNETLFYCLFMGILFFVLGVASLSDQSPIGRAPILAFVCHIVSLTAVLFYRSMHRKYAIAMAAGPVILIVFLFVQMEIGARATIEFYVITAIAIFLLLYSRRVFALAGAAERLDFRNQCSG